MSEHPPKPPHGVLSMFKKLVEGKFSKLEERSDSYGRYAIKYETSDKLPFWVVGRGSTYTDVVSVHKELLGLWQGPILLAWHTEEEGWRFYLLSSQLVYQNEHWENEPPERPGVKMINFSIFITDPLESLDRIPEAWQKISTKTEAKKRMDLASYY
jgi:hypothetical protein